jgi:hypothetical protein
LGLEATDSRSNVLESSLETALSLLTTQLYPYPPLGVGVRERGEFRSSCIPKCPETKLSTLTVLELNSTET